MKNQKICNLRAIAIFMVVLGHSVILYSPTWTYYESDIVCRPLASMHRVIDIIQMPLYFSISGYLFYYSQGKKKKFIQFIKDKAKRLLVPFLIFSFFWMVPIKLLVNYSGYQNQGIITILSKKIIWGNDNGHLWFLEALFLIFVFMYFVCGFLYAHKNDKLNTIVLIVLLLFSYFSYVIKAIPCLRNAAIYMFWFYMGFLLNYHQQYLMSRKKIVSIAGIIVSTIGIVIYFVIPSSVVKYLASFTCVATLYYIVPGSTNKFTRKIEENSYGIYLFHSPLIYITCTYLLNTNPIIMVFVNFIIFGGLSFIFTDLIKKTKFKFILGE